MKRILSITVVLLALVIAPSMVSAFGFYGMDGDCPMLFNVRFGDPAEHVIKVISAKVENPSYKSSIVEDGQTLLTWKVSSPGQEAATALFDKNMRLVALGVVTKTYEVSAAEDRIVGMMMTVDNTEGSESKVVINTDTHVQIRMACGGRIGYEFEVQMGTNSYGNTYAVVSIISIDMRK